MRRGCASGCIRSIIIRTSKYGAQPKSWTRRHVRSSNGQAEQRYIINTPIRIGGREWPIEVSLSNRHTMAHRMLLGRSALDAQSVNIHPWSEYLQGKLSFDVYANLALTDPPRRSLKSRF